MAVYSNYKPRSIIEEETKQVIQEAYFGKTPELLKAENILGEWRRKYSGLSNRFITQAMADPLYLQFCDQMALTFGFKDYILVLQGVGVNNSSTCPMSYVLTYNDVNVVKTKTGYKFSPNDAIVMIQNIPLFTLFDQSLTDGEIMAICLHEIGHNFSPKADNIIGIKGITFAIIYTIAFISNLFSGRIVTACRDYFIIDAGGRDMYKELTRMEANSKSLATLVSIIKFFAGLPTTLLYNIAAFAKPLISILGLTNILRKRLIDLILMPIGYSDERIADQFAVIYGYGPELNSGLEKISYNPALAHKLVNKIPVINWINDLICIPCDWLARIFDPHPTMSSRRKNSINYLEAEMKKSGLNKKQIMELTSDIRKIDEAMDELQETGALDGALVHKLHLAVTSKLSKGDDFREYFTDSDKDVNRMDKLGESTIENVFNNIQLD